MRAALWVGLAIVVALLGAGAWMLVLANGLGGLESGLATLAAIALVVLAFAVGLGFAVFEAFAPPQDPP